jgi:hypothetical protein
VAVRAPTAGDVDQHDFVAETRVRIRNDLAFKIGKTEVEWLGGILDTGVLIGVGWFGETLRARLLRPESRDHAGIFLC